ncbi:hypothetical protein BpHYR1_043508 [Brachionus plicatilis]|uniref:Uncharacterized protein n=1 Tax=Brachionus plicatilis TaxID=10195 RepID=A0A3M7RF49_BRAPC|nr:hypothetical protein BpHYR1_043508 [Brachionus plicatilis]
MVSMVLVPYGINPNFDIVPRVMVTTKLVMIFFEMKIRKKKFTMGTIAISFVHGQIRAIGQVSIQFDMIIVKCQIL